MSISKFQKVNPFYLTVPSGTAAQNVSWSCWRHRTIASNVAGRLQGACSVKCQSREVVGVEAGFAVAVTWEALERSPKDPASCVSVWRRQGCGGVWIRQLAISLG